MERLLTSTLSLVIAATTIGERIGIIYAQMSGALILVAVITCIITPTGFKKLMPKTESEKEKKTITFIGANQMTLPVTLELSPEDYHVRILHVRQEKKEEKLADPVFDVEVLPDYEYETLRFTFPLYLSSICFKYFVPPSIFCTGSKALFTPSAFAATDREMTHPSLLLNTTTGFPIRSGRNTRSHEQ